MLKEDTQRLKTITSVKEGKIDEFRSDSDKEFRFDSDRKYGNTEMITEPGLSRGAEMEDKAEIK
jgi:hypothetical protein